MAPVGAPEEPFDEAKVDKRTFSYVDGAFAFMMTRKLSMELFKLLKAKGVVLQQDWKEFKDEWTKADKG